MTKAFMRGPDNCSGISHAGIAYIADENGVVEVAPEVIDAAFSHGFALLRAKESPKPLAKTATGKEGVADDSVSGGGKFAQADDIKPAQKGAKAAKGGAE